MTTETKPDTRPDITNHPGGGFTVQGADGIKYFKACTLKGAIKMYALTGMIPTRGVTITKMLALAKEFTGKDYKRGQAMIAHADLEVWCSTMKSALKIV
ncbi:hypothetical protein Lumi_100 [Xylophilus phage Lumi]|nr:hypothetical protein Lumi_100 [Xylophilus phage Lumi]